METHVFGYGSLVNRLTHDHAPAAPGRVTGWRREWRGTAMRRLAFLSAAPDPGCAIDGLVALVDDWPGLDRRETGYDRVPLPPEHVAGDVRDGVAIYAIPPDTEPQSLDDHPILLSYIDVVVQGFLAEFGTEGVHRFFETTAGWQAPVLDDRARPIYPRAQRLTGDTLDLVDSELARLRVRRITVEPEWRP